MIDASDLRAILSADRTENMLTTIVARRVIPEPSGLILDVEMVTLMKILDVTIRAIDEGIRGYTLRTDL